LEPKAHLGTKPYDPTNTQGPPLSTSVNNTLQNNENISIKKLINSRKIKTFFGLAQIYHQTLIPNSRPIIISGRQGHHHLQE